MPKIHEHSILTSIGAKTHRNLFFNHNANHTANINRELYRMSLWEWQLMSNSWAVYSVWDVGSFYRGHYMTLTQIKFEDLTNEDRLEINKRLIVSLANSVGEKYQNYLLGTQSNIQEITDSINEFSDALRFIGVRSSHFINAMLLWSAPQ